MKTVKILNSLGSAIFFEISKNNFQKRFRLLGSLIPLCEKWTYTRRISFTGVILVDFICFNTLGKCNGTNLKLLSISSLVIASERLCSGTVGE
jgi:hypothetical protein